MAQLSIEDPELSRFGCQLRLFRRECEGQFSLDIKFSNSPVK